MKKAIIVQPIENKDKEEILENQQDAIKYLQSKEYEIISMLLTDEVIELIKSSPKNILTYIGNLIKNLIQCDTVYFTTGWTLSKECRIVRLACLLYDIKIENDKTIED